MALHYQTEYRLGHRGRVCRSYTGFQAFVAIAFDLFFGLFFELVFAMIAMAVEIAVLAAHLAVRMLQLYWRVLLAAMTLIVSLATLPFVWIHQAVDRLRSRETGEPDASEWGRGTTGKPGWAMGREL